MFFWVFPSLFKVGVVNAGGVSFSSCSLQLFITLSCWALSLILSLIDLSCLRWHWCSILNLHFCLNAGWYKIKRLSPEASEHMSLAEMAMTWDVCDLAMLKIWRMGDLCYCLYEINLCYCLYEIEDVNGPS